MFRNLASQRPSRGAVLMAALALTLALTAPAAADVQDTSGDVGQTDPPATVKEGARESDVEIIAFEERHGVTLAHDVIVDAGEPGTYAADHGDGVVPAGITVDSHFVHGDAIGTASRVLLAGSVTFDAEIVAVIADGDKLIATHDVFGSPGTSYPGIPGPGLEETGAGADSFTLSSDRRTLTVDFSSRTSADQVRVLTLADPFCEIMRYSGAPEPTPAPPSLVEAVLESDTRVPVVTERETNLAGPLQVDATEPGSYDGDAAVAGDIPAGSLVNSHILHADRVGSTVDAVLFDGTVRWCYPTLGLIFTQESLDESDDDLGNPSTIYPTQMNRKLDGGVNIDLVTLSDDRGTVAIDWRTAQHVDQLRVVTADAPADSDGDGVPDSIDSMPHAIDCGGVAATIVGTAGNDHIHGTDGDDVIHGLGGDDHILGFDGDDILCGGDDDDKLKGGKGDDVIRGGDGDDDLKGYHGDDVLDGGDGDDRLDGKNGYDSADGGDGIDRCKSAEVVTGCEDVVTPLL